MHEYEKFPELVGDVYDAALDPALWGGVLARITDFVGGRAGALLSKDTTSKFGDLRYNHNFDPHFIRAYSETYTQLGPMASLPRVGHVQTIPDLVSYDDYRKSRFHQEWLRPQGCDDAAYVVLEKSGPDRAVILGLIPSKANSMVDGEMRRRITLLVPHARRALLIGKTMELKQTEATSFTDTLNGLSVGVFLVDAEGAAVHVNAAGHDMLYTGDFLHSIGGRFGARDPKANQTLHEALAAAAHGDAGIGSKGVALPLNTQHGERYVAHVLPLTSGARHGPGVPHKAVAAVFIRKAELGSPLDVVAQTYKLTPAELRVLHAIVEIGGVPETAEALGVAETTVKTHLYRLFDKTDVSRQADLVKLVAGFTNPLVDR